MLHPETAHVVTHKVEKIKSRQGELEVTRPEMEYYTMAIQRELETTRKEMERASMEMDRNTKTALAKHALEVDSLKNEVSRLEKEQADSIHCTGMSALKSEHCMKEERETIEKDPETTSSRAARSRFL